MTFLSKERKGRITGSRVAAALGHSPWQTRGDLIREMVREYHNAPREFTGNVATEYGNVHEVDARMAYEMETGNQVKDSKFYSKGDLGATPDGEVGNDGLVEFKCPFKLRNGGEFKSIRTQGHYYHQMQMQLFCTRRLWCDFFQWSPFGTKLERVYLDEYWITDHEATLRDFMKEFHKELDNPDHLKSIRKNVTNPDAFRLVNEYDDLKEAIDLAKERQAAILKELSKEGECTIGKRKLTLVKKKGSVSYAKVVKKYCPDADLEEFRGKEIEYWKLS